MVFTFSSTNPNSAYNAAAMEPLFLPFICLLLSLALVPLVAPRFWHKHYATVAAFWAAMFLAMFFARRETTEATHHLAHSLLAEYLPFILLLTALYVIAGGIRITGKLAGTPTVNLAILAIGAASASWIGTTGAAMLFIRPLLRANEKRRFRVHMVIYFIILVANCGGALTPLGDPPLFLGFLHGVDFFWTTEHMLPLTLLVCGILLVQFWLLDSFLWRREKHSHTPEEEHPEETKLNVEGAANFALLAGVLLAVIASSGTGDGAAVTVWGVHLTYGELGRDLALLGLAWLSWRWTPKHIRTENHFTWFPMKEVAAIFVAIFITIIPLLEALKGGELMVTEVLHGSAHYFWITGLLSSILDNAPTYLVFFNAAGGDAQVLMTEKSHLLLAISAGAVFMGALTYIGNAPNFMVRAIAQERGVKMPGFFGYTFWAALILMPIFALMTLIWFL